MICESPLGALGDGPPSRGKKWPWLRLTAAAVLLAVAAFAGWIIYRNALRLTPEKLAHARARWEQANIQDYDIQVQVKGRAAATYFVQVRGGKVVSAWQKPGNQPSYILEETVDGKKVERRVETLPFRSLEDARAWTVPGLFVEILDRDLQNEAREGQTAAYSTVKFDPHNGHPVRYVRTTPQGTYALEVTLTLK